MGLYVAWLTHGISALPVSELVGQLIELLTCLGDGSIFLCVLNQWQGLGEVDDCYWSSVCDHGQLHYSEVLYVCTRRERVKLTDKRSVNLFVIIENVERWPSKVG